MDDHDLTMLVTGIKVSAEGFVGCIGISSLSKESVLELYELLVPILDDCYGISLFIPQHEVTNRFIYWRSIYVAYDDGNFCGSVIVAGSHWSKSKKLYKLVVKVLETSFGKINLTINMSMNPQTFRDDMYYGLDLIRPFF